MNENKTVPLPYLDIVEQRILEEVKGAGGVVFRTDLRRKLSGSNTTLVRKIISLKEKGIIEEIKERAPENGRLKTAYKFTEYANRLLNIENALKMKKWFSASQKIELFPEFEQIARSMMGSNFSVYEMLGIKPQHMFLETLLATSSPPPLKDEEIREVLTACNAVFQNVVTGKLHPQLQDEVEGYILFHYKLEQPKEPQRLLPQCIMNYVMFSDPLERHRESNKIVELTIQYPQLPLSLTMAAANVARSLKLEEDFKDLLQKYKAFKRKEEPMQLTRIELILSALNIFKKLYASYREKSAVATELTSKE